MRHLTKGRFALALSGLLALLLASVLLGLGVGPSWIPPDRVFAALIGSDVDGALVDIVLRIRLPRVLLAALVGASLSTAGVIFQALLRNPLADPFILGVSGGAALAGIAMLSLGGAIGLGYSAVPPAAFAGCLLTTLLLYLVAGRGSRVSATGLLLTGVVFNAFASAAIVFLASLSGLVDGSRIFIWLIGSLSVVRVELAGWVALFLAVGLTCAIGLSRGLNLMALGDEAAAQLGVAIERDKRILLLATSLMVGAAVSVSGLVGFVGLIIPHLLRLALGPDHRLLVPAAAIGGAAFLVVCDTMARTVLGGRELPVGAITALVGGPFFLFLLRRSQHRVFAPGAAR
ncbi:MAG: iron ABC transporter permease [Deltaproteobacteria bacterium]|nr:iron ABC transporter permease [Deltaproteobacteria bacterium]